MSYIYTYDGTNPSINLWATSTADILFYFKQTLKQAGWTVIKSSDGITYNSSSDIITHTGSGAGGMGNSPGWYVLKHPASNRQIQVWKPNTWTDPATGTVYSSGGGLVAVYYSYSAGFISGSPTATARSTATDEKLIMGDAAWNLMFTQITSSSNMRLHISADNTNPYGFYMFWHDIGSYSVNNIWMMDPLQPGSYNSSDADPYVFYFTGGYWAQSPAVPYNIYMASSKFNSPGSHTNMWNETDAKSAPKCWYKKGLLGESWVNMPTMAYCSGGSSVSIPQSLYTNPYTNYDSVFPLSYGRRSGIDISTSGFKGVSSMVQWSGCNRTTGDTLSISGPGSRDKIVCGSLALPWNGSIPKV